MKIPLLTKAKALRQIMNEEKCLSVITEDCDFMENEINQILGMVMSSLYTAVVCAFGERAENATLKELRQLHLKEMIV